MHNLRLRGIHVRPTAARDLADRARYRHSQLMFNPTCTHPITTLANSATTMPPRKKVAPDDSGSHAIRDPPTTGSVRSIARLASRGMAVAANLNPTTDGATSSKPASKAKTNIAPIHNPASQTTKPPGSPGAGHTGADAGDDGDDVPASKSPADVDTRGDKKMVTSTSFQQFARADFCIKAPVLQLERGAAPVDPHSGMVGKCPIASVGSVYR